jgi:hypothetical protein
MPSRTEVLEAEKQVRAAKARSSFMQLQFQTSYSSRIVLPYEDAVKLLAALEHAELLNTNYGGASRVSPIEEGTVTVQLLSRQEYEDHKVSALLNASPDEIRKAREAKEDSQT